MNITIRHIEPGDAEAIVKIFSGPKAIWGTLQIPYPSVEMWRKRLAEPPEGMYGLVACVDGEVVGQIALHTFPNSPRRRHTADLGMAVRDDWQGKRVGAALMQAAVELADKWINISRLRLEVYTDNEPAIALYKKFGFQIEGKCVRADFRDGEFADTYVMARLRAPLRA